MINAPNEAGLTINEEKTVLMINANKAVGLYQDGSKLTWVERGVPWKSDLKRKRDIKRS